MIPIPAIEAIVDPITDPVVTAFKVITTAV